MKQTKGFQIWQIIYPVGLYYVVSSLCYFALEILLGSADETYMLRQLVGDAVTIPVILNFIWQIKTSGILFTEKRSFALAVSRQSILP